MFAAIGLRYNIRAVYGYRVKFVRFIAAPINQFVRLVSADLSYWLIGSRYKS